MGRFASALILTTVLVAGCSDMPRDPERTSALVRESGTIRVGWVDGADADAAVREVLAEVERKSGAKVERTPGDSEQLLSELQDGKLDLVYGNFAQQSPWAKHVHLGKSVGWRAEPPKHVETPRFAYRKGENGWIMRVETLVAKP